MRGGRIVAVGSRLGDLRASRTQDRRHRRTRPARRAGLHRRAHPHGHGRLQPPRSGPAPHEGSRGLHPAARRLRREEAGRPVADRRSLGSRTVESSAASDQGAARSRHRRPPHLPRATGRPHGRLQQSRPEARRHHPGHARPAGWGDRARQFRRADRGPERRGDGGDRRRAPRAHPGRASRSAAHSDEACGVGRRHVGSGSAGHSGRSRGLGRLAGRARDDRPRQLSALAVQLGRGRSPSGPR